MQKTGGHSDFFTDILPFLRNIFPELSVHNDKTAYAWKERETRVVAKGVAVKSKIGCGLYQHWATTIVRTLNRKGPAFRHAYISLLTQYCR